MVNGQSAKPQSDTHTRNPPAENTDANDTAGASVIVVNQQTHQRQENDQTGKPPSYFHELLVPANLPNLLLVGVGIAGIMAAFLSLRTVNRQVAEMRRQVDLTFGQLRAMHEQITEMSTQTDVLERSVAVAKESADAAKQSADIASAVSIPTLVVHEFDLGNPPGASLEAMLQFPTAKLVVKNYGQTPAFLSSWKVIFTCENLPDIPNYSDHPGSGMVLDKEVIRPDDSYTFPTFSGWQRQEFSLEDVRAIMEKRKILNVYGYVCYGDIFDNPIRRLKFCETAINLFPGNNPRIGWFSQLAPTAYRGTDLMPIKESSGQRVEGQTVSTNPKAEHRPEKAN